MADSVRTPPIEDTPGAWPETPAESLGHQKSFLGPIGAQAVTERPLLPPPRGLVEGDAKSRSDPISPIMIAVPHKPSSNEQTPVSLPADSATDYDRDVTAISTPRAPTPQGACDDENHDEPAGFAPLKTAQSRPNMVHRTSSGGRITETELFQALSRRRTNASEHSGRGTKEHSEEQVEVERLMSRMFGQGRQANSEEEKTRHVGVSFRHLTVKGVGLGAALQPTNGDTFLGLPRSIGKLLRKGPKRVSTPVRTILNDFSGCVKPGEMLLVLGRPGSGCSTFLKVIGNQRYGFEKISGDVSYGGTDAKVMAKDFRGEILYQPEDDLHSATLTVQNTLEFALKTRTPGKDSRQEGESRKQYVAEFLRVVSKLFWIEHTMGTKVGDSLVRGVSGGEKKRVSIAEAMITKASTGCWDNSTRGLDASTALEYVQSLRTLTNMAQVSTLVALYQAGESLYSLFDKVIVIEGGRCIYFGATEDAKAYFQDLGFTCLNRWTTADFLTSVTDENAREIREGWEARIPRSAEQFEQAFRTSQLAEKNLDDIAEFEAHVKEQVRRREASMTKRTTKKNYTIPFHQQVWACTYRQFLVVKGDKLSTYGKWGGIIFQSLIVGSLFYKMPQTTAGVFTRGGIMFFLLLFNALLALAELTSAFAGRPIMLKHKSFSFYRPAAYAVAQTVLDVPLVFVQVFLFDMVIYFMSGLARTASQFFISVLTLFVLTMAMYSFFRAVGALSKSLDNATRITGVAIQALIVYTGYLIPVPKMHPWFKWLIWLNPVQYGFECLMANEFTGLKIECVPPNLIPSGPNAVPGHQACSIQGSQPGSTVVDGAAYIQTAFTYTRAHLWRNIGIMIAFWTFFLALTMLGMEIQKPNHGGRSTTIFKRGQVPHRVEREIEAGQLPPDEERGKQTSLEVEKDTGSSGSEGEGITGVAKNEAIFTWQKVNYRIPVKDGERKLLQDVQGYVRPGKLTALMGASGAGKTTLLNTLAQRISFGLVEGDFLVDGRPLPKSFQRATGFAEQQDVHEPTATVREALRFSALLRQPKETSRQEKYDYVEKIIRLLEMEDIAGAIIGTSGAGLDQEQRKRVTIGVELAAKPELLMFLDEPTSGLDSGAAFNIIRFLRKLADAGQAILCTIHQPSSVLFEFFDEIILLKEGGRVVYHGSLGKDSRQLIDYFEAHGAKKCPTNANPAEYMLEAIGAGDPNYKGQDWGDVWAQSKHHEERTSEIQQMVHERKSVSTLDSISDEREYAMPLGTQILEVVKRCFVAYWRTPDYTIGKFMLHIVTGLFNTFTFFQIGNSVIDMQSRLFSVFMTLTICPPLIQQLQPRFLAFRNIYQSREANSKIYSWIAFVTGAIVVELPYSIVAGTVYFNCWYWGIGYPRDSFTAGYNWIILMLFEVYYVGFGQAVASISPNELFASLLVPVFFLFIVSFCGVVVPFAVLPAFWRAWMYYLTPFRYLLEGFLGVLLHNVPVVCAANEFARFMPPPNLTCDAYLAPSIAQAGGYVQTAANGQCEFCPYKTGDEFAAGLNIHFSRRWIDFGVLVAFCLLNFVIVYLCSCLYLGGWRRLRARLSPKERKQRAQPVKAA